MLTASSGATFVQRREHRDDAEHAAGDVHHGRAGAQRPAWRPGHVGEAAHHLRYLVEGGAVLVGSGQETLEAEVDQPGVARRELGVAESELVHGSRPEILDYHVHLVDEPPH